MSNQRPHRQRFPRPEPKRWQCRYSPSEMLYLELTDTGVKQYLHHSPQNADHTPFADVLAGKIDADVRNFFGESALHELKAEVRAKLNASPPEPTP